MSGGHFDYMQYNLTQIADAIDDLIIGNHSPDDFGYVAAYPETVIEKFKEGAALLRKAQIFAQRIDWLVSGDDGVENFFARLDNDLAALTQSKGGSE